MRSRDGQLLQHAADGRRANRKPLGQGVARHRIVFGAAKFQDGFQIVVCGLAVVETGSSRPRHFVLHAKSSLTVPERCVIFSMPKYVFAACVAALIVPRTLPAQGETTSAISGLVTDETGSGIPGADIAAVSEENGQKRSLKTDQAGRFAFPQLKPGTYTVEASAPQFRPQRKSAVAASLGNNQTVNFTLSVAALRGDITVNSEAPLLNTQNPNTSSTLNARVMEDLPNPGGDLTYPLQFAAGALINTA
jgi:hypothetical protein